MSHFRGEQSFGIDIGAHPAGSGGDVLANQSSRALRRQRDPCMVRALRKRRCSRLVLSSPFFTSLGMHFVLALGSCACLSVLETKPSAALPAWKVCPSPILETAEKELFDRNLRSQDLELSRPFPPEPSPPEEGPAGWAKALPSVTCFVGQMSSEARPSFRLASPHHPNKGIRQADLHT